MSMNTIRATTAKALLMLAGAFSLVSNASADPGQSVHIKAASIPFAFRVGNNTLPAGNYKLEQWTPGNPSYYLKNVKTGRSLMVTRLSGNEGHPILLTFEKDNTGYVLKRVH
jgi:hypothetical protein